MNAYIWIRSYEIKLKGPYCAAVLTQKSKNQNWCNRCKCRSNGLPLFSSNGQRSRLLGCLPPRSFWVESSCLRRRSSFFALEVLTSSSRPRLAAALVSCFVDLSSDDWLRCCEDRRVMRLERSSDLQPNQTNQTKFISLKNTAGQILDWIGLKLQGYS